MSEFGSYSTLSAHEILRFSIDHGNMSVRQVALHHPRVVISLRDLAPQRSRWELEHVRNTVRVTRFPSLRSPAVDSPLGNRVEGRITPELFARIVATHRPAIVSMVRADIALLTDVSSGALGLNEEGAGVVEQRLREIQRVARRLFPADFPRAGEGR